MDDLERKFLLLKEHFDKVDVRIIEEKGLHVFDTAHGIWGCSGLRDMFALFRREGLEGGFTDLGSGDGRIALLAALFTQSCGIEGDAWLHSLALEAKDALIQDIPELARCELRHGDYTRMDLPAHRTFFIYADHAWDAEFERRLQAHGGVLLSYNNIFSPAILRKGRTLWVEQTPIVTYSLGSAGDGQADR